PKSSTSPLVNAATARGYPPGSTFKVVTAAAALESGRYTPASRFPDPVQLELPQTNNTLMNFTHTACLNGTSIDLFTALRVSCDTTFAMLGLRIPNEIHGMAANMGFNSRISFDIATEASTYPDVPDDEAPLRAYAAIGQGDTVATPLQMALVAATVANDGVEPRPRLVRRIEDPSGGLIESFSPEMLGRAFSDQTAQELKRMMTAVVQDGTGTAAQIPGVQVAGKTGTAQTVAGAAPHTWFISFAPVENPRIAVAVIVEHGGSFGSEATGGAVAAPIAKQIIEAHRQIEGW
ncbi:MAG TPA: penicillin-binding transpeptidase domain-containing protein, partial [Actinomycetota bacterium]|nr:penicillin-binding transpeptidase domain-containing protein [Actinomycetota bacterium]